MILWPLRGGFQRRETQKQKYHLKRNCQLKPCSEAQNELKQLYVAVFQFGLYWRWCSVYPQPPGLPASFTDIRIFLYPPSEYHVLLVFKLSPFITSYTLAVGSARPACSWLCFRGQQDWLGLLGLAGIGMTRLDLAGLGCAELIFWVVTCFIFYVLIFTSFRNMYVEWFLLSRPRAESRVAAWTNLSAPSAAPAKPSQAQAKPEQRLNKRKHNFEYALSWAKMWGRINGTAVPNSNNKNPSGVYCVKLIICCAGGWNHPEIIKHD